MAIFEIAKNGFWSNNFCRQNDLFDFTNFFGLDFFKFYGPLWLLAGTAQSMKSQQKGHKKDKPSPIHQ